MSHINGVLNKSGQE